MVDRHLLELLVCPVTKTGLRYDSDKKELLSDRARLAYPLIEDVPIMIVDQARHMDAKEVKK